MNHFTSQQLLRMGSAWDAYRARHQLKPLPLPGNTLLRVNRPPPAPPAKKSAAPAAKPRTAPARAKPVALAARTAPKKVIKPPVKRVAG